MPQVDLGVIEQWSPNFMASGTRFIEDSVSTDDGGGGGGGYWFGMTQVPYACALYF